MQYFKYIRETIEPLNSIAPYDTCTIYTTYCVMNRVRESAWHKQRKMKLTPTYLLHSPSPPYHLPHNPTNCHLIHVTVDVIRQ